MIHSTVHCCVVDVAWPIDYILIYLLRSYRIYYTCSSRQSIKHVSMYQCVYCSTEASNQITTTILCQMCRNLFSSLKSVFVCNYFESLLNDHCVCVYFTSVERRTSFCSRMDRKRIYLGILCLWGAGNGNA